MYLQLFRSNKLKKKINQVYVFRGNPFQAPSLYQSYNPTQYLNRKNIIKNKKYKFKNLKLIYLTFIRCTNKQVTELN